MEPIYKYNNGNGAMICNICRTIISTGPKTEELYCEKCKPKQETLEEVAERLYPENIESIMDGYHDSNSYQRESFIKGYKLAQKRSYSEEEVLEQLNCLMKMPSSELDDFTNDNDLITTKWFEQFKKK